MTLSIDFETRSDVDLKKCGVYRYFESPHADVLLASFTLDGGPVRRWRRGEPCPADVRAHIEAGGEVKAHNASFERIAFTLVMGPKHGWPVPRREQFRCTAATAAALSLPRDLARLGDALGLSVTKDKAGGALIKRFCIPRNPVAMVQAREAVMTALVAEGLA